MHAYLEKMVAALGTVCRKVLPLSDFELALFLGIVLGASLAFIAACVSWLQGKRKKKRRFLLERELYRVQETDDTSNTGRKTVIDAFRIRFPFDDPPEKRPSVEHQMDTTDEGVARAEHLRRQGNRHFSES